MVPRRHLVDGSDLRLLGTYFGKRAETDEAMSRVSELDVSCGGL
jgi:hypothetical protein